MANKDYRMGIDGRLVPLLTPADIAATATNTSFLDMKGVQHATLYAFFGSITAASADQPIVVTLTVATGAATTSEVALAFSYRLSGAVATDTWTNPTAATSAGVSIATTDDNKILAIDVDPAVLEAALADGRFVHLLITPDAGGTATVVGCWAAIEPMYASVAEASAS